MKCPGNDRKKPEDMVSYVKCSCGYDVELWFDEHKRKCLKCGEYVYKNEEDILKDFKCANWCKNAEKCLGPAYQKFTEAKESVEEKRKACLEELLKGIPEGEIEVVEFFLHAYKENTDLTILIDAEKSVKPLNDKNHELYKKVIHYYSKYTKNDGAARI